MASEKRSFSAPGRVEIGGNHTDHQRGRVLAAAINLEVSAVAQANDSGVVRLFASDDFSGPPTAEVDLGNLGVIADETGTSAALVRGVAAFFRSNDYGTGGFDAAVSSSVPIGAGLSSSAAFEVLIGRIFHGLFCREALAPPDLMIARAGQYAENVYFGKPSGLMDQAASSYGGLRMFDFIDPAEPVVKQVNADFAGYSLCVVNTGGTHADLTPDYASIPGEMGAIAAHFGKEFLRDVNEAEFYSSLRGLRHLGDRAVLRAIHFFAENRRVLEQVEALERRDMQAFFGLVIESGRSSLAYLQNVYSPSDPQQQGLMLALERSSAILNKQGAWRVHGGGFAGTILAFVPDDAKGRYGAEMSGIFGEGCCHFLEIR